MKKQLKKMVALTMMVSVIGGSTQVFATSSNVRQWLPKDRTICLTNPKSTNTKKIAYRLNAVYPDGNYTEDTYKRIKLQARKGTEGKVLMSERVIYEGKPVATVSYSTKLKKGDKVSFWARGNDPKLGAMMDIFLNWY